MDVIFWVLKNKKLSKTMKNIVKIALGLIACVTLFTACKDDESPVPFQLDKTELTVGAEGAEETIAVTSPDEWIAVASEPWVMISPANGIGSATCNVVIDSTLINGIRTADIKFTSKGQVQVVKVNQTGFGHVIAIEQPDVEIAASAKYSERFFETTVVTNVQFSVSCEDANGPVDWVTTKQPTIDLEYGARPRTVKIRFDWKLNVKSEERKATIKFTPVNPDEQLEEPAVLNLTQKAAPLIEDNRAGDSLALLIIQERFNAMIGTWDSGENMRNWDNLILWERGDKGMPEGAEGRVRSVSFQFLDTNEGFPAEFAHLKYLESLAVQSNTNTVLKSIKLGSEICNLKYLKNLRIFAYGLVSLPDDFVKLGATLEHLDLSANNFNTIPDIICKENFPKLKDLIMIANRRWTITDLRERGNYEEGIGLYFNTKEDSKNILRRLLLWDSLEHIVLQNNYMEGNIPDFEIGRDGVRGYTQEDLVAYGDTLSYLVNDPEGQQIPRILPNLKRLSINLNFFSGELPKWVLYHPHLKDWFPEILFYPQEERGVNSDGNIVGFSNVPRVYDYYYKAYPKYRAKYEMKENYE